MPGSGVTGVASTVTGGAQASQREGGGLTTDSHALPLRVLHVLHELPGQLLQLLHLLQGQRSWGPRGAHLQSQHSLYTLSRVTPPKNIPQSAYPLSSNKDQLPSLPFPRCSGLTLDTLDLRVLTTLPRPQHHTNKGKGMSLPPPLPKPPWQPQTGQND